MHCPECCCPLPCQLDTGTPSTLGNDALSGMGRAGDVGGAASGCVKPSSQFFGMPLISLFCVTPLCQKSCITPCLLLNLTAGHLTHQRLSWGLVASSPFMRPILGRCPSGRCSVFFADTLHICVLMGGVFQAFAEHPPRCSGNSTRHNPQGNQTHRNTVKGNVQGQCCNKSSREQHSLEENTAHHFTTILRARK